MYHLAVTPVKVLWKSRRQIESSTYELEEYQRRLRKSLPIKDRVEIYERAAKKVDHNPFAALKALERVDKLDGILTPEDQLRYQQPEQLSHQPLFILPGNATVNLTMKSPLERRLDEAIDINP